MAQILVLILFLPPLFFSFFSHSIYISYGISFSVSLLIFCLAFYLFLCLSFLSEYLFLLFFSLLSPCYCVSCKNSFPFLIHTVDQMLFNETSFDLFQCISDNDAVFNKREGLYTERIRRTCIEHHFLRVTYLKQYFLVLSSS